MKTRLDCRKVNLVLTTLRAWRIVILLAFLGSVGLATLSAQTRAQAPMQMSVRNSGSGGNRIVRSSKNR